MSKQPPPSAEALDLSRRVRERYHAPGNEHVLELNEAAEEIDALCEQRVSAERKSWLREDAKAMRPFEEDAAAILAECERGYEGDEPHKIEVIARALRQRVEAERGRCEKIFAAASVNLWADKAERPAPEIMRELPRSEKHVNVDDLVSSLRGVGVEQPTQDTAEVGCCGWVLVPREPTVSMLVAGAECEKHQLLIWRAMIAEAAQESFQCPACRWHEGHDPAEWFRGEVSIYLSNKARDPKAETTAAPSSGITALLTRASDMLCHYATDYPQPGALSLINEIDRALARGHYSPPAAVVDYTERARERPDGSIHVTLNKLPGFHFILARGEGVGALLAALDQFLELYLSAVASERDAALLAERRNRQDAERDTERLRARNLDLVNKYDALLARLQEPDEALVRAVAVAICEAWFYCGIDTPDGAAQWRRTEAENMKKARAALTKITEMLTP